jgi:hypothetical protein
VRLFQQFCYSSDDGTNGVTVFFECSFFIGGEFIFHNLFYVVSTNDARKTSKNILFAVFSVKGSADGHDFLFVMKNSADDGGSGTADALFCAVFVLISDPASFDGAVFMYNVGLPVIIYNRWEDEAYDLYYR